MELDYDLIELFIKNNPINIGAEDFNLSNREKNLLVNMSIVYLIHTIYSYDC